MFAWYQVVFVAGQHLDVNAARSMLFQPRGLALLDLYRHRSHLDEHPYMLSISAGTDPQAYAGYSRHVLAQLQPHNFFWQQYRPAEATKPRPLSSSNPQN